MSYRIFIFIFLLSPFLITSTTSICFAGEAKSGTKKQKTKKKSGKSKSCPFGKGPMEKRICPGPKQKQLVKAVGAERANCLGRLFMSESGCSHTVKHDKKKAKNPYAGIGLCAIEASPAVRRQNGRGAVCSDISSFAKQIKCCDSIVRKHGAAYFGTMKCGKAPRC